jgi:hypothetical protein
MVHIKNITGTRQIYHTQYGTRYGTKKSFRSCSQFVPPLLLILVSVKVENGNVFRRISLLDVEGAGLPPSLPLHRSQFFYVIIIVCFLLYLKR